MSATVVSAPGKVLLAGGYLVLDPAYSGVVVSTSSRFYTVVRTGTSNEIRVHSPQFVGGAWSYTVKLAETSVQVEPSPSAPGKNKFVHLALQIALAIALEVNGAAQFSQSFGTGLDITIAGDNDFYSQEDQLKKLNLPSNIESLSKIPPFSHIGVTLADVAKTGLGSSAALITSLVTALLVHFAVLPRALDTPARLLAHNVSQFVHCLAQGKVGSGFDVSAAVFGSQLYTRFSPEVIKPLMDGTAGTQPLFPTLSPQNPAWDYRVEPFQLPPFTRLLLADIHAGSNTPSLVGKVLKWREQDSTIAHSLWTALDQLNTSLGQTLLRLSDVQAQNPEAYLASIRYMASVQSWLANPNMQQYAPVLEPFYEAHLLAEQIRAKMREMGALAGVEIEPPPQTKLLDDSIALAGIVGGGVPGAGGYDAVWLLVVDPPESIPGMRPLERVERLWSTWPGVTPLRAEASARAGVVIEDLDAVPGLRQAVESAAA